ncbi:MAG: hypothetical protein LBE01_06815 [Deltaproteobacteria bacterium]|jgi:homocitrate synthase NifV|nr:hypothetical protein [Deltaproteobacteria bacterium]
MLLIDATLAALAAEGRTVGTQLTQKWVKALSAIGISRVKRPNEPVVAECAVYGLDGALAGDYQAIFKRLRRLGHLEVVFGDSRGWASALAFAWLEEGGTGTVASLTGVGGLPALERLRVFLHLNGRMLLPKEGRDFAVIRQLWGELTGQSLDLFHPVLGEGLFVGEAGIHVDCWSKDPSLYELFPPALVGAKRALAIGRHSGQGALRLKCRQLGLACPQEALAGLLDSVRDKAVELERSLTDSEFAALARGRLETRLEA